MAIKVGKRGAVPPFIVMDVMRAAGRLEAEGKDVLHLEVGQPGTAAPAAVLDAAREALAGNRIGYTEATGVPALRRRIAEHYRQAYGVALDLERVMVTAGSSGGFLLGFLAAFDPGDRVAMAVPGYPAYRNILTALDIEPVLIPTGPEERFQPTPELIERHLLDEGRRLDGLIIASPSNPTGTMLDRASLEALVAYCAAEGIRLVSDEIYHGISFGEPGTSALELTEDAIVINSFSKYYSMTGWRLGWMILPEVLIRPVECLSQNLFISPPTLSQLAAIAAFDCSAVLDGYVADYARNRELLLRELPKAGFDSLAPADGAFYLYADVTRLTNDSEAFCRRMLAEAEVAATPGTDFDPLRGQGFVRFSFAGPTAEMARAAKRLQDWQSGMI